MTWTLQETYLVAGSAVAATVGLVAFLRSKKKAAYALAEMYHVMRVANADEEAERRLAGEPAPRPAVGTRIMLDQFAKEHPGKALEAHIHYEQVVAQEMARRQAEEQQAPTLKYP